MEQRLKCDLCNSTSDYWAQMFIKNNYTFVKCKRCGFVFTKQVPSNAELSNAYSKGYYNGEVYNNYEDSHFERLIKYINALGSFQRSTRINSGEILEIGCATGDFLDAAKFLGYDTNGIEISEWAASIAKRKGHNIINIDVTEYEISEGHSFKYDAIFMWDVFEHLAYPNTVLKNVTKLLNKGGCVVINTLNIGSPTVKYLNKRWSQYMPPYHLSFFNMKTMNIILKQNNLRMVEIRTHGPLFYDGDSNKNYVLKFLFNNRIISTLSNRLNLGYAQTVEGILE